MKPQNACFLVLGFHYNHYWIGLKDAPIEGQWRWIETGSNLGAYNKWADGQPDGSTDQNCVTTVIANGTSVYWADARCEGRAGHGGNNFICEKAYADLYYCVDLIIYSHSQACSPLLYRNEDRL